MLAFDTHKFVKDLTKAGMAVEQAEVLAATYATILTEQVATKADIRALQKEITGLRTEFSARLDSQDEKLVSMETVLRTEMTAMEESLRKDMTGLEESLRKDMTGMEERMDLKLQAVEQRLERKIVNTSLINVVATCTILGLVITILT